MHKGRLAAESASKGVPLQRPPTRPPGHIMLFWSLCRQTLRLSAAKPLAARSRARLLALLLALLALALLSGCGLPGTIAGGGGLPATKAVPTATPLPPVRFPQDEAPHTDLTEWWYYTGHFHSASGHEYGFELTFFQTLRGSLPPYMPRTMPSATSRVASSTTTSRWASARRRPYRPLARQRAFT